MRAMADFLVDLLYPKAPLCPLCGLEYGEQFCHRCLSQLKGATTLNCKICGRVIDKPVEKNNPLCELCSLQRPLFSFCAAVGVYGGLLREAIHLFKYTGKQSLCGLLARLMLESIVTDDRFLSADLLMPVPLHDEKKIARSFNQAELLAVTVAGELGLPVGDGLIRVKNTLTQSKLTANQRKANLSKAFGFAGESTELEGRRIVLIDDIMTTGTTAEECTRVLLEVGAEEVCIAVLAVGRTGH